MFARLTVFTQFLLFTGILQTAAAATAVADVVEGTDPRCPNNNNPGVKSYVFTSSGIQRCFNVYRPSPNEGEEDVPTAVMMMAHGSGSNANLWCGKPAVRASFASMGVTLLCTSSAIIDGDKRWRPPPEGSSEANPYPCTEADSIDLPYYETILDWIESQPARYDRERVFNGGFSQGSNFISYVSFCFPERLRGVATSGSGLKVNGPAVEFCSAFDTAQRGLCEVGVTDGWANTGNTGTCDGCRFTPMRPVDGATDVVGEPLRACINVGEFDSRVQGSDQYRYYYEKAGLRTEFTIWPGVRHAMPPDWPAVYDDCLGITASARPLTSSPTLSPNLPPTSPTLPPTSDSTCVDDPEWRFRGTDRSCDWVASRQNVLRNCNKRANVPITDKTKVWSYCKATCHAAGQIEACP